MATTIGLPDPEPEFKGTPGASFMQLLHEAELHAQRHPSLLNRMVDDALHGTQKDQRKIAMQWIHDHASFLYKV